MGANAQGPQALRAATLPSEEVRRLAGPGHFKWPLEGALEEQGWGFPRKMHEAGGIGGGMTALAQAKGVDLSWASFSVWALHKSLCPFHLCPTSLTQYCMDNGDVSAGEKGIHEVNDFFFFFFCEILR